jgi:hypothetical protein
MKSIHYFYGIGRANQHPTFHALFDAMEITMIAGGRFAPSTMVD